MYTRRAAEDPYNILQLRSGISPVLPGSGVLPRTPRGRRRLSNFDEASRNRDVGNRTNASVTFANWEARRLLIPISPIKRIPGRHHVGLPIENALGSSLLYTFPIAGGGSMWRSGRNCPGNYPTTNMYPDV